MRVTAEDFKLLTSANYVIRSAGDRALIAPICPDKDHRPPGQRAQAVYVVTWLCDEGVEHKSAFCAEHTAHRRAQPPRHFACGEHAAPCSIIRVETLAVRPGWVEVEP